MANFHVTIDGKPREVRRMLFDELIVIADLAHEQERIALLKDKAELHDIDAALADLRARKGDPFMLWKYVKSFAGSRQVLDQIGLDDVKDTLTREQALEIVGQACGFTVTIRKDSEEEEARPTQAAGTG